MQAPGMLRVLNTKQALERMRKLLLATPRG
jgi:hypothetical protein